VSTSEILALGAIAGFTIFLGLPVGRMRAPAPTTRAFLNAVAIGILVFLLWDVLKGAQEPLEAAVVAAAGHKGHWGRVMELAVPFVGGMGIGLLSLVYYERWMGRRSSRARAPGAAFGPGAAAVEELAPGRRHPLSSAQQLALFIAIGIGLHNFSEGLAIGQSAAKGEVSLALSLIIGFGLHNATEGFGIVGPLAGDATPSWGFLALLGLIGGGPTFVGTIVGQSVVNDVVSIAFLALAAGSILYVVVQLLKMAQRQGRPEVLMWGILLGLFAGFATDLVLVAGGG